MKTQCVNLQGVVMAILPDAHFRVKLDRYPDVNSICYLSGKLGKGFNKPSLSDRVEVDYSPNDLTKGRITKLLTK